MKQVTLSTDISKYRKRFFCI